MFLNSFLFHSQLKKYFSTLFLFLAKYGEESFKIPSSPLLLKYLISFILFRIRAKYSKKLKYCI
ncbi:hypothetical protein CW304_05595 [Bacillus sp. UFRGS-B20]|nr:hypothetical protein CW304_05595 [Bacillus sp. UFRGS-B20]